MLHIIEKIPEGLASSPATELEEILKAPTLIHLRGEKNPPLLLSILLHGNEISGLAVVQKLLRNFKGHTLPRSLSLFIGNVRAARHGIRYLDDQQDFNRVWQAGAGLEYSMAQQVIDAMAEKGVFACIDIHNNSGRNPHYACITDLSQRSLDLASLFSERIVYFTRPAGSLISAVEPFAAAVAVECGQVGDQAGIEKAYAFVKYCLQNDALTNQKSRHQNLDLFHSLTTVRIPAGVSFGFDHDAADLRCLKEIEQMNFKELPKNTLIGWVNIQSKARLMVLDERGCEVGDQYLDYSNGEIRTKLPIMPSMLTCDRNIIHQDCLGYFMKRIPLPERGHDA